MDLSAIFTPSFFAQGGTTAVVLYVAFKAITKLYNDMREDSKSREDKLMAHLEKVSGTLENINQRLCVVENCVKKDGDTK
jgi:hypothetical protein